MPGQQYVVLYEGEGLVNSFRDKNAGTGTLDIPTFKVSSEYINLLVGGGNNPQEDDAHDATAVNLIVDGEVVRTATGNDSDALDWAAWNVSEFAGKNAQIQIVDQNTGDWGHILVDQITFSDKAAQNSVERANSAEYGSDFYAAISYNSLPDDQHTWVGWISTGLIVAKRRPIPGATRRACHAISRWSRSMAKFALSRHRSSRSRISAPDRDSTPTTSISQAERWSLVTPRPKGRRLRS